MRKIAFLRPSSYHPWGGDLKALLDLRKGLKELDQEVVITSDFSEALLSDALFFIGTLTNQEPYMHCMNLLQREYGVIAFHEDHLLHSGPSFGFAYFIAKALAKESVGSFSFHLEDLIERPHLIYYFDQMRPLHALENYAFLEKASCIIASSLTEERTLQRDVPGAKTKVVHWTAGHASEISQIPDDSFLKWTGLKSQDYILQIGRLSLRKNQLATLLATKDLDLPLVFIAMDRANPTYQALFLEAALKWRKSPVLLITQTPIEGNEKVKVLSTEGKAILSQEMLLSALFHAKLHLHPAFYELPGYTYLESSFFGVPTIASRWGSLRDYFVDPVTQNYLLDDRMSYVLPYDLKAIRQEVEKKWGSRYPMNCEIPIYKRRATDVAQDFLKAIF